MTAFWCSWLISVDWNVVISYFRHNKTLKCPEICPEIYWKKLGPEISLFADGTPEMRNATTYEPADGFIRQREHLPAANDVCWRRAKNIEDKRKLAPGLEDA